MNADMAVGDAANPPIRWLRRARWALGALLALVVVFHGAGGWYFASVLDTRALSASARWDALTPDYELNVVAVEGNTVTIEIADDQDELVREGIWGLEWKSGYGQLGKIRSLDEGRVTRDFQHLLGEPLSPGTRAALDVRAFPGDPRTAHSLEFEDVTYPGELGDNPAWFLPGNRSTWVIYVHGNGMTPRDALRALPTSVEAGFPSLVITYRGDNTAPADRSGRLRYGLTEWRDLEAAAQYALDHGAESLVLHGYSMGGGVIMAFLVESALADRVAGVVLDAPMLDFERTVEFQAEDERIPLVGLPLPSTLLTSAEWLAARRFDVDWDGLDYLQYADQLSAPILLIHGDADEDVPMATSEELARLRPDVVTYMPVAGAGHVQGWNVDPTGYDDAVAAFMEQVSPD